MTDDPSSIKPDKGHPQKSWFDRIAQVFTDEPQNREQLLEVLREAHVRNLFDKQALAMIEGVLQVSEEQVRDIMVPRSQMIVVDKDASLDEMIQVVAPSGHSRFPVIGDNKDEVEGVILAKDLLQYMGERKNEFDIKDILRPAVFIPESKRLNVLLNEFRASRNHMAIVIDEYSGVAGLVTIEDVLEEIVGEIDDEHDVEDDADIRPYGDARYIVNALTELEDFNDYFKVNIDEEESDTVGGFIIRKLGYLPRRGEFIKHEQLRFKVLSADSRRIHRLQLEVLKTASA